MAHVYILLLAFYLLTEISGGKKDWGPYEFMLKESEPCKDEGTGQVTFSNKMNSLDNGKHSYSGPLVFGVPVDEYFKIYFDVQKKSSQGWRPRAIEYTVKNCEDVRKQFKDNYKSLIKAAGINAEKCPIPKGNYTVVNWEIDFKPTNIHALQYNTYKVMSHFYYKDVKVGCHGIIVEIVPK